ncbi:MAG TPA: hypothetical protein VEY68_02250 [Anoxybacillus sp.]|nr:hypothetical protein [Anoxybacillus sp.]
MDPIRIGLLFSLTGTTSFTEIRQYRAALYALEQFQENYRDSGFTFTHEIRDILSAQIQRRATGMQSIWPDLE